VSAVKALRFGILGPRNAAAPKGKAKAEFRQLNQRPAATVNRFLNSFVAFRYFGNCFFQIVGIFFTRPAPM
jgi:hypothetical protein